VRELVREPMKNYLRSSVGLIKNVVSSFPAFRHRSKDTATDPNSYFQNLSAKDMEALLDHAFERYFETSGLFGTPATCVDLIQRLKAIGVNEIACLVDFGVDPDAVLENLPHLNALRQLSNRKSREAPEYNSVGAQIKKHSVSHLQCTPSLVRMLLSDGKAREALGSLRQLFVGGEVLPPALAKELKDLVAGEVINMYGPTETTVWSSSYTLNDLQTTVPIGRPIANTELYILNRHLQLVPIGVSGELCIGGEGVARGYLGRPKLTAERFISHPFRDDPRARLYRTGDMARYLPDGNVEFLGRADHQVKIRGHRIELGEIEAVLQDHPAVREVVVISREDTPGEKRLVAYLVAEKGSPPAVSDLRRYLNGKLPDYMVPAVFVTMGALPLTPNKKVDRRALPFPDQERPKLDYQFVAPRTPVEETLSCLWAEALGLEQVGIHDNFIDLGGDSLAAVEVSFKIQERFEVEFPLHTLFQFPSVASLSKELEKRLSRQSCAIGVALLLDVVDTVYALAPSLVAL
jgi:acyl-CoA synthetase (AMP-forming)/AMP-acid ligase II/acyl carrier protein